jgi:aryl-alcohol dehydrogenase-like predicted oxidoreductase
MSSTTPLLIPKVHLGSQGLLVSKQGLGCMGMTAQYGEFNRRAHEPLSLKTITNALEYGINFFDTAWGYQSLGMDGCENSFNEEILGKAIAAHGRTKFIISTKSGLHCPHFKQHAHNMVQIFTKEAFHKRLSESLLHLGTHYIDLYFVHPDELNLPIEATMCAVKELVCGGSIKYVGLYDCTPDELRRAHAVQPITAVQVEWSLHSRHHHADLVATARELGIGIVACCPLDRGLLTGTITNTSELDARDTRRGCVRFSSRNLQKNVPTPSFFSLAILKGSTPAQLALAWLHAKGSDVIPIPGTKWPHHLWENAQAAAVELTADEVREIAQLVSPAVGDCHERVGESRSIAAGTAKLIVTID